LYLIIKPRELKNKNMETIYWGPAGWRFLHTLTFLYPEIPDTGDKILMQELMNLLSNILPCKYCRASFTKYSVSLDIVPFLESRELIIDWLYKMHNKVNKKLRSQGFCNYDNPSIEHVYKLYLPHVAKVNHLNESGEGGTNRAINYICKLGQEFLGSIVFNYQGYFANCHTSEEKSKIAVSYHRFFNIILPLIKRFIHPSRKYKLVPVSKFRIRNMLQQNESYSRLKRWFFECQELCNINDGKMTYEDYEAEFNKHIVSSCNTPKADFIKSCRKIKSSKKNTKKKN
jgi:hypothetical protein